MTPAAFSLPEAKDLLQSKQYGRLKEMLAAAELALIAAQWAKASLFERIVFYKLLSAEKAEKFFGTLPPDQQIFLLGTVEMGTLGPVLDEMEPAAAEKIFHRLPGDAVQRMRTSLLRGT